tara:strand:+ start:418 stop:888 length:471 start_codon:yes stop_codon:yes gene_type:complete
MSNSAFKMRGFSGFGNSPIKDYRKSLQYKLSGKAGRAKMDAKYASGENTKLQKDVKSVGSKLDKAIQGFFNNPRGKQRTGKNEYVAPKQGVASGGGSGSGSGGGFKPQVRKDSWGTYRTTEGGGYEYKKKGDSSWTTAKSKKGTAAIDKLFKNKKK